MQWSPDSYALDFAEENGFIDASTIEEKTEKRKSNFAISKCNFQIISISNVFRAL